MALVGPTWLGAMPQSAGATGSYTFVALTLGSPASYASAINAAGQVTGTAQTPCSEWHAFLYSNGVLIDLGTLGGEHSFPRTINAAGQVVG